MKLRWIAPSVLLGLLLGIVACRKPAPPPIVSSKLEEEAGEDLFEDIAASSGIKFSYRNGEDSANHLAILESLGGGVALIDYDGDGLLDVFFPGGGYFTGPDKKTITGSPCKLFRNLGKGKFEDVTAKVGLDKLAGGKPWFYTHGAAVGDYNRDGFSDLLVTGWGRIALFRNDPVDPKDPTKGRKFTDVSAEAKLDKGIEWASSAAWGDLDGDGYPDLYVCQYVNWSFKNHPPCVYDGKTPDVCPPKNFSGLRHKVFRNLTDGTFADVTVEAGIVPGGPDTSKGLGVLMIDTDGDGKPEVYVANDTVDKFFYVNQSKPGKIVLVEKGTTSGVARDDKGSPNGSMGLDAGDPDHKGKPWLWVTNYENELHALYRNEGKKDMQFFSFQTSEAGIAMLGQRYVGWGTAFLDADLDGWEDLFVANGHAIRHPTSKGVTRKQRPVLMLSRAGKFRVATKRLGTYGQADHLSRGAAFGDLYNDGHIDIVVNNTNEQAGVLHGIGGKDHHWIGVQLVGKGHACIVGSRVVVEANDMTQTRFSKGGGSYMSSNDRRHHFGLGKATKIDRLTVHWADGTQKEFTDLAVDKYHRLEQGK